MMTRGLKIEGTILHGVQKLLEHLLGSGKVGAVFALCAKNGNGPMGYSLITDPDALKEAAPLFPLMPASAAKVLSRLTRQGPFKEIVAAVVRPCELRAFVELTKRNQASSENLVFICPTCAGVYPLKMSLQEGFGDAVDRYWKEVASAADVSAVRPSCKACEHFVPTGADIIVEVAGSEAAGEQCRLLLNTDRGAGLVEGLGGEAFEGQVESPRFPDIRRRRSEEKKKLIDDPALGRGIKELVTLFSRCLGCHGCREVCPVCYCVMCQFDSSRQEYDAARYDAEVSKRGGLRLPPATLTFQLGRMTHSGLHCVGCGQCSDVCPVDIPISTFFLKVGAAVQELFNYLPGEAGVPFPLTTFEMQEHGRFEE